MMMKIINIIMIMMIATTTKTMMIAVSMAT